MDEIEKETTRPACVEKPASRENPLGNWTDGGLPAHHALDALFLSEITETLGMPAGTSGVNSLGYRAMRQRKTNLSARRACLRCSSHCFRRRYRP
jgi:hypothetical protein